MTTVKAKNKIDRNNTGKPYEKPGLRIIELETDQVLAVGCKMDGAGSAVGIPASCVGNFCAEVGS
ncbi:MAG: hypothetical protein PVH61_04705 [Candidatus Aminicenantes bacterium]|jgi:hypothetical protein